MVPGRGLQGRGGTGCRPWAAAPPDMFREVVGSRSSWLMGDGTEAQPVVSPLYPMCPHLLPSSATRESPPLSTSLAVQLLQQPAFVLSVASGLV